MNPRIVTRLTSTGAMFGPGGGSTALYCEMSPHSGIRANGLTRRSTAFRTSPPTLSKSVGLGSPTGRLFNSTRRFVVVDTLGSSRTDCPPRPGALQPPDCSAIVRDMTATARLAEFVHTTSLRDCPDAVLAQTRRATLDTLGVVLAGASEPVARAVRAVASADGSVPLCTVFGTRLRVSTA